MLFKNEVTDIASSVKKLTARQDNTRADLRQQKGEINQCNARIDAMQDKMADLEDRNRLCNIRPVGLPERVEGDDPVRFLQKEIPRWFPAMKSNGDHPPLELNRAHRIYSDGNRDSSGAHTLIFQCLRYTDRQRILQAARKSDPVVVQGRKLSFYVDYSSITAAKRRVFGEVRAKCRSHGVDNFLVYPAVLKVNYGGACLSFDTQDEVAAFVSQHFQDFAVLAVSTVRKALRFPLEEKMD
ncbi:LINE-1 type transposase domain-containing protein 1 [Acipenser ruthenus]|uniref:LINE-1 type transposase domain-containing protein 1 n=1 Tax=Acipenser ruthenus TaxID=7906 RepID=A0A444V769_ACIRT|nr:LINE-1 type transposase domain-containing protein 1 [Acipenser ruthenus]